MSPRELIERAIAMYGSEAKLGAAIGYSQHGVHRAKRQGRSTWEMACLIHHVTGGVIDKHQLCPEHDVITRRINGVAASRTAGYRKRSARKRNRTRHFSGRRGS